MGREADSDPASSLGEAAVSLGEAVRKRRLAEQELASVASVPTPGSLAVCAAERLDRAIEEEDGAWERFHGLRHGHPEAADRPDTAPYGTDLEIRIPISIELLANGDREVLADAAAEQAREAVLDLPPAPAAAVADPPCSGPGPGYAHAPHGDCPGYAFDRT